MNDLPRFATVVPEEEPTTAEEAIARKILHTLMIYPVISPSMLQSGIGSAIGPKIWRPIFNHLIEEKKIKQDDFVHTGPSGRTQVYSMVSLYDTVVHFPK